MKNGQWVSVTSGIWRYSVCVGFGGEMLQTNIGEPIGWVIADDCREPSKHVLRRMMRRLAKLLRRGGVRKV